MGGHLEAFIELFTVSERLDDGVNLANASAELGVMQVCVACERCGAIRTDTPVDSCCALCQRPWSGQKPVAPMLVLS